MDYFEWIFVVISISIGVLALVAAIGIQIDEWRDIRRTYRAR